MKLLCLETSTDVCSVSIILDEQPLVTEVAMHAFEHSKIITTLIEVALKKAGLKIQEIEGIVVASGPGSYTSLRVGAATAKGLCIALSIPLYSINSLLILADGIRSEANVNFDYIIPMIDARRDEVYTTIYDGNLNVVTPQHSYILTEFSFEHLNGSIIIGGNGSIKAKNLIKNSNLSYSFVTESTSNLMKNIAIGLHNDKKIENIRMFTPDYHKAPNITLSTKKMF